jgi:hypothetical protein
MPTIFFHSLQAAFGSLASRPHKFPHIPRRFETWRFGGIPFNSSACSATAARIVRDWHFQPLTTLPLALRYLHGIAGCVTIASIFQDPTQS